MVLLGCYRLFEPMFCHADDNDSQRQLDFCLLFPPERSSFAWSFLIEEVAFIIGPSFGKEVENNLINIAKKLGEYALKKGSGDNISIIILFFK
jgi:hypothetical protein